MQHSTCRFPFWVAIVLLWLAGNPLAHAQPTQVWQRTFGEAPRTQATVTQLVQLRPNRLVGVGSKVRFGTFPYPYWVTVWHFNALGDTIQSRSYPLRNGAYLNALPLPGGDLLLTGAADTTTQTAFAYNYCFYVRADSLGNWRGRPRYLTTYHSSGGATPLVKLPGSGALWAHSVFTTLPPPGSFGGVGGVQAVRLDSAQRLVWQRRYDGPTPNPGGSYVSSMAKLLDGSYVLIGTKARIYQPPSSTPPFFVANGWMQRIRANGDTINLPEYFGHIYEWYEANDVQPTADGGFVIAGNIYPDKYVPVFNCCPNSQGWLAKFDSLGTLQWEQRVLGRNLARSPQASFTHVQPLANGQYLVSGLRSGNVLYTQDDYLAAYAPTATGAAPVWEVYGPNADANARGLFGQPTELQPNGSLTFAGQIRLNASAGGVSDTRYPGVLTRFANAGAPLVLDYCRHPPVPNAGYVLTPARDTLTLVDFSTGGPRFALVERWRWHYPDGSFYEGRTPPPHRFATVPAAGSAVTLTVTNNLGCSATQMIYPFGLPTAAQQARAWAAGASVFPNPAAGGQATLALAGLPPRAAVTAQVADALGRAIGPRYFGTISSDGTTALRLPIAGLGAGLYVVRIQVGSTSFSKKLVIQ
jgi:hypothetical protein